MFKNINSKIVFFFLLISKIVGANLNRHIFLIAAGQILADYKVKKITHKKFNRILFIKNLGKLRSQILGTSETVISK